MWLRLWKSTLRESVESRSHFVELLSHNMNHMYAFAGKWVSVEDRQSNQAKKMALDATGMTLGGPPQSGYNWSFFDRSESSNRRNSHDLGSLDPDALGFEPGTAMAIDECARIFTGIAKPKDFNVTCLDHAPVLTHMVIIMLFPPMTDAFAYVQTNEKSSRTGFDKSSVASLTRGILIKPYSG